MLPEIWSVTDIIFVIFGPFTPQLNTKIKIWKKCNKMPQDIILLHMCTMNEDPVMYSF